MTGKVRMLLGPEAHGSPASMRPGHYDREGIAEMRPVEIEAWSFNEARPL